MRRPAPPRRLAAAALLLLLPGAAARAQWVTGLGEDAIVLPAGMVRVSVGGAFGGFDERFSSAVDGAPTGDRRPYGAGLSAPSLDAAALPALGVIDGSLRAVAGAGIPGVTFGRLSVTADARRAELPIRIDVGLGRRVQLSVAGSYVQTRVAVGVRGDPTATEANLGVDPANADGGAAAANAALVTQLRQAADALTAQLATCGGGGAAQACARPDDAAALRTALATAATGIEGAYTTGTGPTAGYVPVAGSALAAAVDARLGALAASAGEYGITALQPDARPRHAAAPISPGALQALADAGAPSLGLPPIRESRRYGIGDVEIGARVRLLDPLAGRLHVADTAAGTRVRASALALLRLGTGDPDDPRDPLDVGVGDGQTDVEVGLAADVLRGRRFVASFGARYGVQLADELDRMGAAPGAIDGSGAVTRMRRDLGDYLELEATPRYAINDYLTVGGHYRFRAKAADTYEHTAALPPTTLDPALPGTLPIGGPIGDAEALGLGTETRQHVAGAGIVFSTLPAFARGQTRWPVDVTLRRTVTVAGAGRLAERWTRDEVALRVYLTPFGRPGR